MANGFFAGAAEGLQAANELSLKRDTLTQDLGLRTRALDIQQQGQSHMIARDAYARADAQIASTMAIVGETTQALIDSGKDPATVAQKVQPLIQSAKSLAEKAGRDPSALDAQLATLLAKPKTPQNLEVIEEDSFGGKKRGFVDKYNQTVTPPTTLAPNSMNLTGPDKKITGIDVQDAPVEAPPVGDAYLKTIPQEIRSLVKQVAEYSVQPKDLSIKGGHRERVLAAAQLYDPTYDSLLAPARAAAIKEFNAGGANSPAGRITAGNTGMKHLGDVSDAAEEMKALPGLVQSVANSGVPFLSYAVAVAKNKSVAGTPEGAALAKFATAVNHFSEEVTKFYSGSTGSEAERSRALENLNAAKSLTELRAAIAQEAKLMKGNVDSLQQRWHQALGPKAFERKLGEGDFPLIQKDAASALLKIDARAKGSSAMPPPPPGTVVTR